jgi:hypothetical protein
LGGLWFQANPGNTSKSLSQSIAEHGGVHLSSQATGESKIGKIMISGQPEQKEFAKLHLLERVKEGEYSQCILLHTNKVFLK